MQPGKSKQLTKGAVESVTERALVPGPGRARGREPSHPGLAHPSQRRASRPTAWPPSLRWRPLCLWPPSHTFSPFSKKLITARVPVTAAMPASGQAAVAPAGERAVEGEGEPLSELRLGRFLFFFEDMLHWQPGS